MIFGAFEYIVHGLKWVCQNDNLEDKDMVDETFAMVGREQNQSRELLIELVR